MRLGVVEMMPGDFRTWTKDHTRAVRDLGFTGFGFHLEGETAFEITPDDCRRYHEFMAGRASIWRSSPSSTGNACSHPTRRSARR